jgi:hypothetical protein
MGLGLGTDSASHCGDTSQDSADTVRAALDSIVNAAAT